MRRSLMKNILIIEDDKTCASELKELLKNANYEVTTIDDFEDVPSQILKINPDLVLLDINIPNMNGELVLEHLRKKSNIKVIMLTSRNSESDELLSMSFGSDDYITKPYNPNILLLRINAVLRRGTELNSNINYHGLNIDLQKGIIKTDDKEIILTKNEMIIFAYLLNNRDRIVSRDELMTDLWNNDEYINDNALTVNISRLRGKLKEAGLDDTLETRKKVGYILK